MIRAILIAAVLLAAAPAFAQNASGRMVGDPGKEWCKQHPRASVCQGSR